MWLGVGQSTASSEELFRQARLKAARGDFLAAEQLARAAAEDGPVADEARLLAAELAGRRKAYSEALRDLDQISEGSAQWLPARKAAAELLQYDLCRLREAEACYQAILARHPDDAAANDGYARLLGRCGRRAEAFSYVLRLIRAGHRTDLLMLVARDSGLLNDPDLLEAAVAADPDDANPLLGQAAAADAGQEYETALNRLDAASRCENIPPCYIGMLGRQLLNNRKTERLQQWVQTSQFQMFDAEAWLVRGDIAEANGDLEGAARCAWEASRLLPELLSALSQLAGRLRTIGRADSAVQTDPRIQQMHTLRSLQHQVLMSNQEVDEDGFVQLLSAYMSVGRFWEALGWARLAVDRFPDGTQVRKLALELEQLTTDLPLELTAPGFNTAASLDLSDLALPRELRTETSGPNATTIATVSFDHTQNCGFDFQFFSGADHRTNRMFELGGGGVAVIDVDGDTAPDLFCTQGALMEGDLLEDTELHGELFRNQGGQQFRDVSASAGFSNWQHSEGSDFGSGVAAGDFNNDGFPDLYAAAIGRNTLWMNNGDGTFSPVADETDVDREWTSSCLMADLNGDSYPDLYDVNYLEGDDLLERICRAKDGLPTLCTPYDFDGALDRIRLSSGDGGFVDVTADFLTPAPRGKGLGIAAFRSGPGLSFFVANDTVANFFYTADSARPTIMTDQAMTAGLAFNGRGTAEACMGVAVGDCNRDGRTDLLVTNFLHESNTLYCAVGERLFEDQTEKLGLHDVSLPVLGVWLAVSGCQPGRSTGAVHCEWPYQRLQPPWDPYRMRPHVLSWTPDGFQSLPENVLGPWSEQEFVGRAVAVTDWNQDGQPDVAMGCLEDPYLLLTNTSPTAGKHFLRVQLVADTSARDAIGTVIRVTCGSDQQVFQLTAGDGYQCSSERCLLIGCGDAAIVDELEVNWPSGPTQVFRILSTDQRLILIEGRTIRSVPL
ncbi:MAG: FG-GAP-like repeat-containing protein [Planctomycetaceae bacterium]